MKSCILKFQTAFTGQENWSSIYRCKYLLAFFLKYIFNLSLVFKQLLETENGKLIDWFFDFKEILVKYREK